MLTEANGGITKERLLLSAADIALLSAVLVALYGSSLYSYLLFHSLAELFSIVVAFGIFIVAWNTRKVIGNHYLLFLGIAYLFVGGLDLVHTLAYKGMDVFEGYGPNLPTQLWIGARYTESLSLLMATFFLKRKFRSFTVIALYSAASILLLGAIFTGTFPDCFIEGSGLTAFKKISEYVICLILLSSLTALYKNREEFDRPVFQVIASSILFTVGSELSFTFYVSVYGLSNLLGHFFKLVSFLIYKALIETGLSRPYNLLFRDLSKREERTKHLASFPRLNPNPVMETDISGKITYVNPAIEKILTGLGFDKTGTNVFLPDDFGDILRELKKKAESFVQCEVIIKERVFNSAVHFVPEFNVVRIYSYDITERRKVEEAIIRTKEEWERTFDSVPDMIAILDPEHRIVRVNRAMAEKLGTSADKCIGLTCFTCVHGTSGPPGICPHSLTMGDGKEHTAELREDRLGGDFLVTTTPIFDDTGRMTGSVHVARDITERKKAEAERERLLEELMRSNTELEQFAYIASHDLQEPLRMISSYVELIAHRYRGKLDSDADEFIGFMVSGTTHMKALLNDLLMYSRVGRQRDPLQTTDLNQVMDMAIMNLRTAIDENHALITREDLPTVLADKVQMVQIFQNLIANALKFRSDEPPRIHISADHDENEWTIRVRDNGIGIDPKY